MGILVGVNFLMLRRTVASGNYLSIERKFLISGANMKSTRNYIVTFEQFHQVNLDTTLSWQFEITRTRTKLKIYVTFLSSKNKKAPVLLNGSETLRLIKQLQINYNHSFSGTVAKYD